MIPDMPTTALGCHLTYRFRYLARASVGTLGACGVLFLACASFGQSGQDPADPVPPPASTQPSSDQQPAVVPVAPAPLPAPIPARPRGPVLRPPQVNAPGKDGTEPVRPMEAAPPARDLNLSVSPPLVREGAFIASGFGQMVRGKSGRAYFVFQRDASGKTFPPMILLEGPNLAALERLSEVATPTSRIRIGGQVLVYRDHNYLLITTPPLMERGVEASTPPPGETPADSTQPGAGDPAQGDAPSRATAANQGEKSIDDIIAEMDRAVGSRQSVGARRPIQSPGDLTQNGSGAAAPASSAAGTTSTYETGAAAMDSRTLGYLTSRRGRLVRSPDGWLTFRPDSGSSGKPEPAMALLPCQNLMALETISDSHGDATTLTVSGEVFVYQGRRHLLPSVYVVDRASTNVQPTQ